MRTRSSQMWRFTIRELVLLTVIVAMGTVLVVEHWPFTRGQVLSPQEAAIYAAALRYSIAGYGTEGAVHLSVAGADPPRHFRGPIFLPASHCEIDDRRIPIGDAPRVRLRDRYTNEAATLVTVDNLRWLSKEFV